jgi:DNA polymerase III gamma/tau subunit
MTDVLTFTAAEGEEFEPGDLVFIGKDGLLRKSVATAGHNSGATPKDLEALLAQLPTTDQLAEMLVTGNKEALERVDALLKKGVEFLTIQDDDQDSQATEFLVKLRARFKQSEADRVAAKTPFDDAAGSVQAFFKTRILDPLGAAPSNKNEEFDPVTSDHYGLGVRITMAQTLYKRAKAEKERKEREARAEAARKAEAEAKAKREAEEKERKAKADAVAKAAREKAEKEAADRKAAQDKADQEAADLAAAAGRKRNEEAKAKAEADAKAAKEKADKLKAEQEEADRKAKAEQDERDRKAKVEEEERKRLALEEENALAESRSKLEEAAAAPTADLSRARGGKGGVSSLKEFVDFRDLDRNKLGDYDPENPVEPSICKLLPFVKDAALESAVKEYAKANKHTVETGIKTGKQPIRGVVYFMNSKSAGRA